MPKMQYKTETRGMQVHRRPMAEGKRMPYRTSTIYQTPDRIIIDIRALSISIWKKPRLWRWAWRGWLWLEAGPVEVMLHRAA